MTNTIAIFQISTDEDLRFQLVFNGLDLTGRTLEVLVKERSSNATKATLTIGSGLTLSGTNTVTARYAKASMASWATTEYSADLVDKTDSQPIRVMAVRVIYDEPGKLVYGVRGNKAIINWSPNQAVVTAIGGIGPDGPPNVLTIGDVETLETGEEATATITGDSPNQALNLGLPKGNTGTAATIAVGDVTTGAPGTDAEVENVGTSEAAVFDFTIPAGAAATIEVGDVATGAPGSAASVENVGTDAAAVFDFSIPQGDTGWSPELAVVTDGVRRVVQVVDWVGGTGTKPATGEYVGATGLVPDIADAVDIRGAQGVSGSVTDGDKGDVLVSSSGTVWTVQSAAGSLIVNTTLRLGRFEGSAQIEMLGDNTANRVLDIGDFPNLTTANADVRLFRSTNTSGTKHFTIYRGNGTSTYDHSFTPGTASTVADLARNGGNVLINGQVAWHAGNLPLFTTRSAAIASTIGATSAAYLRTAGYAAAGDKGGALYKKVGSEPSHSGKFQDASGAWWEIAEAFPNVLMFGADPSGTADSLAAFTAALTIGVAICIEVPAGTFKLSGPIVLGQYQRLRGTGQSTSILSSSSTTADILQMNGYFCHASGFRFAASVTKTAGYAINFTVACASSSLDDFYTEGTTLNGINISATSDTRITNGTINAGASPGVGINIADGFAVYIGQVIVGCNPAAPSFASMVCTNLKDVTMEYVQLLQSTANIYINPGNGQEVDSLVCTGCYFDAPTAGGKSIDMSGMTGTGKFQRSSFVNCWFTPGTGGDNISIVATGSEIVNDLMFIGCKYPPSTSLDGTAIYVEGAGVSGLIIANSAIYGHTTGIRLKDIGGAMINGNMIGGGGGFGGNGTGILIDGTSDYCIVVGNKVNGNATAAITNLASGTHNYIAHNPDDGIGIGGTVSVGASPFLHTAGARPEMLYIRGGTVSNVVTDSGSLGTDPGVVYLQPNRACQITYSSAPTVVRQVVG